VLISYGNNQQFLKQIQACIWLLQ